MRVFLIITVLSLLLPKISYPHSGRTDAFGGHYDRKNGGYHFHNKGSYSSYDPAHDIAWILVFFINHEIQREKNRIDKLSPKERAIHDATIDLKKDSVYHFCHGLTVLFTPLTISHIKKTPPIRPERLIGKSYEYNNTYIDYYTKYYRKTLIQASTGGCLITGFIFTSVFYLKKSM